MLAALRRAEIPYRIITASPFSEVETIRSVYGIQTLLPESHIVSGVESSDRFLRLRRVVRSLSLKPSVILLVDDSEDNIAMGNRLGMITARISPQPTKCHTAADYCFEHAADVLDLLVRENLP
jgi:phosphoglycolate phosphatase-like HAD superfamily hydrolase